MDLDTNDKSQLANVIHIEKVVQFTKIEESQYQNEVEELREQVKWAIGNVPDETPLHSMDRVVEILEIMDKLKATLISCGEHSEVSKSRNIREQVMSDPENVMFRLIAAKKKEITDLIKTTFTPLIKVAEMYCLQKNVFVSLNRYNDAVDIIMMIDNLNKYFGQVMGTDGVTVEEVLSNEEMDEKGNPKLLSVTQRKFLNLKRRLEDDAFTPNANEFIRKVAKRVAEIEDDDDERKLGAEKKARKEMIKTRNSAMQPILVDCTLFFRFFRGVDEMESIEDDFIEENIFFLIEEDLTALQNRMGGRDEMLKKLENVINCHFATNFNNLRIAKNGQMKMFEEWKDNQGLHIGMKEKLLEIGKSYQSKSSNSNEVLINKLMNSRRIGPILMGMSFWPVFENSQKRFKDGLPEYDRYDSRARHNLEKCMGICNQKSFQVISSGYKQSTSDQVVRKMCKFLVDLESLRKELFKGFSELINYFQKISAFDFIHREESEFDTFSCLHEMEDHWTMRIDEKSRKNQKKKQKCRVCRVLHTLQHLRFAIGTGSYHGEINNEAGKPIESFLSMVFEIEKERNPQFDGAKQLCDFLLYMERLRQSTVRIHLACDSIINYSYDLTSVPSLAERTTLEEIKTPSAQFSINLFEENHNVNGKKLKKACQELRYMVNLYGKKQNEVSNEGNDDNDENCCPICLLKLEVIANFPCGHRCCESCYRQLRNRTNPNDDLNCSNCRKMFKHDDVIVERRNVAGNPEQSVIPGMKLSVKLEATIRLMKEIIEENPENNKIMLFTTMKFGTRMWRFLKEVLHEAELPFNEVIRNEYNKSNFKFSTQCKILLCSLPLSENRINLTQVNNIIFLDPPYSYSIVKQALAKISRAGQKIKVFHMITEGSIDDEIRKNVKFGEEQEKEFEYAVEDVCVHFGIQR